MFGPTKDVINVYEQDLHQERARKFEGTHQSDDEADESLRSSVDVSGGRFAADVFQRSTGADSYPLQRVWALGKVHASVFIIRSDGLTCCMIRTRLDDFDLVIERGNGALSLYLDPLQLVGGTYFAEAWFLNESDSMAISTREADPIGSLLEVPP